MNPKNSPQYTMWYTTVYKEVCHMMIKRVVSFTQPQLEWLEAEAKKLGISVPELVRRLIDQSRKPHDTQ